MSNNNPENSAIKTFMKNVFFKEGFFDKNKLYLKNHLRQDIVENNEAFCEQGLLYFSTRSYLRNPSSLSEEDFTQEKIDTASEKIAALDKINYALSP